MPIWLPYVSVIMSALIELAKLLMGLAKECDGDAIKDCSLEIAKARASGDVAKLNQLIEKMSKGSKCT